MKLPFFQPKVKGQLGYFKLADWWLSIFTQQERDYIESVYHPIGYDPKKKPLTEGDITFSTGTAANLLSGLSTWFRKPKDYILAKAIVLKAEKVATDTLDQHFVYQAMIEIYYRMRDSDPEAMNKALYACEKQIELSTRATKAWLKESGSPLPAHVGYTQLAVIREKQKDYKAAIELCQAANAQGWNGDWEKRIERCQRKLQSS